MTIGRVKRVLVDKGYGFVTGDDGIDYFVTYSEVHGSRLEDLRVGEIVSFEPRDSARGPRASNVSRL